MTRVPAKHGKVGYSYPNPNSRSRVHFEPSAAGLQSNHWSEDFLMPMAKLDRLQRRAAVLRSVMAALSALVCSAVADPGLAQSPSPAPAQKPAELVQGVSAPPPIEFDPPTIDLGTTRPGSMAPGLARVKNVGQETLVLKETIGNCQCFKVIKLGQETLKPGESTDLVFEMEVSYRLGKPMKPKAVYVYFGGYYEPKVLEVYNEVSYPVRVEPPYLKAEEIDPTRTGEITLTAVDQKPFRVIRVNNEPPVFADGFNPASDAPKNVYRVKWDFTKGKLPPWLLVETDRDDCPIIDIDLLHDEVRLPEREVAQGRLHVSPGGWNFGVWKGATTKTFDVRIHGLEAGQTPQLSTPFSQDVIVGIVGTRPDDRNRERTVYTLKVTPREGFEGLLFTPIYYRVGESQYRTWIYGRVESPAKSTAAASPAGAG